jgi:hypothetical protein
MLECPHSQDWKQAFDYTHHAMDLSLTPHLLRLISFNMGRFVTAIFYLFMRMGVLVSMLNPFKPLSYGREHQYERVSFSGDFFHSGITVGPPTFNLF